MFFQLADWFPVFLSLRVAIIAVFIVTCLGLPLSRLLARREFYGKDLVDRQWQIPVVLVSHDEEDASFLGDIILTLEKGQPGANHKLEFGS